MSTKAIASPALVISRAWEMPSANTFSIKPIADLLDRWLEGRAVIVDPFARDSQRGTITNDLNPATKAQHHMDAVAFAEHVAPECDAVLFDPPYSPRQISECYAAAGLKAGMRDTQNARLCAEVRHFLGKKVRPGGIAISCGWNSVGFGKVSGFVQREILLVCHGGAHNDTIVVVEEKI